VEDMAKDTETTTTTTENAEAENMDVDVTAKSPDGPEAKETGDDNKQDQDAADEDLVKMLAEEKNKAEDYLNRLIRMQADFDNYRKRVAREREELLSRASEQLICTLLPVLDNFERALSVSYDDTEKLLAGMKMISRQFQDILKKEGLTPIPAVGEEFNPELHEAVLKVESEEFAENTVAEELRKGYILNGKVIRPAMVKVAG